MSNMSIRARLIALVALMTVALLAVGIMGIMAVRGEGDVMKDVYEHQTIPMREVARVRRLVVDNGSQIFRAMQHNPGTDYAKLHDHPISMHLDIVRKNVKWLDETFVSLKKGLKAGSEELRLVGEVESMYRGYVASVLEPTMKEVEAGNFSASVVGGFLKGNGAFEAKLNPVMTSLAEAQQGAVKKSFDDAMELANREVMWTTVLVLGAVAGALLVAFLTIRSITRPLNDMQSVIGTAARERDFTGQVPVAANDEVGQTARSFNELMTTLRQALSEIRDNTAKVDDATAALAAAAHQAEGASAQTSESASSMAASVEELSVSITSVSDSTKEAFAIAKAAGDHSETGGKVIANAIDDMAQTAEEVRGVGGTITELGAHSDKISSVVQVIKDVADQTNLLALNAAIEAARAGEAGRGFAVVADEVRKLAERTTQATGEIGQMVTSIQSSARTAVTAMNAITARLQNSAELAAEAASAITAIQKSNADVVGVVHEINTAMAEQGAASQDIAQRVERVAQASEQSSASVKVSSDAARNIHQLSIDMRRNVERFKL
ncbi:MAG: methyl-accepting chemotaxis protein [Rhodocyclales bacterium]|nr:methyl-accepting chemotaxis protein [Rhodocyclales bacterium]